MTLCGAMCVVYPPGVEAGLHASSRTRASAGLVVPATSWTFTGSSRTIHTAKTFVRHGGYVTCKRMVKLVPSAGL